MHSTVFKPFKMNRKEAVFELLRGDTNLAINLTFLTCQTVGYTIRLNSNLIAHYNEQERGRGLI
jgi:hypothetical protein